MPLCLQEAVAEVAIVITLHTFTETFSTNLKKVVSISDATDQSAASNDLSYLKMLRYYSLKADFPILLKYAAMSTKQMS